MITVENTKSNLALQQAVATMAIEDMYFDEDFISEMLKVTRGEKTTDDVRQELYQKYARH